MYRKTFPLCFCKPLIESVIKAISSENNKSSISVISGKSCIPHISLFSINFDNSLTNIENITGLKRHPCRKPTGQSNVFVHSLLNLTQDLTYAYIQYIALKTLPVIPFVVKTCHNFIYLHCKTLF